MTTINDLPPELLLLVFYYLYYSPRYKICRRWKQLLDAKTPSPQEVVMAGHNYPMIFIFKQRWSDAVFGNELLSITENGTLTSAVFEENKVTYRSLDKHATEEMLGVKGTIFHLAQRNNVLAIACSTGIGIHVGDQKTFSTDYAWEALSMMDLLLTNEHIIIAFLDYHYVLNFSLELVDICEYPGCDAFLKTSATRVYTSLDFSIPHDDFRQLRVVNDDCMYALLGNHKAGRITLDTFTEWADSVSYIDTCPDFVFMVIKTPTCETIRVFTHSRVMFFNVDIGARFASIMCFPGHGWHLCVRHKHDYVQVW